MATSPVATNGDRRAILKAMDGKRPAVKIEIVVINRRRLITPDYFEPVWNARRCTILQLMTLTDVYSTGSGEF